MEDNETIDKTIVTSSSDQPTDNYQKLRSLILGEDYEGALKRDLRESDLERVSQVLAEAFEKRNHQDNALAQQLSPVIETAIDTSIKNNPSRITNVIFPIMGPAVRKAVASALSDMVRTLNHLLQQSVNAKALMWRLKAWRAGIPYGEYVLLQTLVYRVEQIFLIHKETGLLIESATALGVEYQDPDLVSSMLTAITDFVSDSFDDSAGSLNKIQFGELNIIIETGPHAALAFAIRGSYPESINDHIQQLLEQLHQNFGSTFVEFNGDLSKFEAIKPILNDALISKSKSTEKKRPWLAIIMLTAAAIFLSYWAIESHLTKIKIEQIVEEIKTEPGYQVLDYEWANDILVVNLLRSPSAKNIEALKVDLFNKDIALRLNAIPALIDDPSLFLASLEQKYRLNLDIESNEQNLILVVKGVSTKDNLLKLKNDPIVSSFFNQVNDAGVSWTVVPSEKALANLKIEQMANDIRNFNIYFEVSATTISKESSEALSQIIRDLKTIISLEDKAERKLLQVSVLGFADYQGQSGANQKLSEARAKLVAEQLLANGIDRDLIVSWGLGEKDKSEIPSKLQRRVSISLLFSELKEAENVFE